MKPGKQRAQADPLRKDAEERLKQAHPPDDGRAAPEVDARRLLHELEVHQIELELQNEELRRARQETEAGLERYTELFDFAPIGYATLSPGDLIREVNHAGARLLDRDRAALIGTRFGSLLIDGDSASFHGLLDRASSSERSES